MSVIAVFNQKGGVGKTTTTLNIAACLAMLERRPTVIDLDPQAHASLALGVRNQAGPLCAPAFFRDATPLGRLLRRLPNGVRLIPAHPDLSKIDATLGSAPGVAGRLRKGLAEASEVHGEPVLLDCAPSLGVLTLNALWAADRVLIPVTSDFLAIQGLKRLEIALKVLEQPLGRAMERRIIMTRHDEGKASCREALADLRQKYGEQVCDTHIRDDAALAESPAHGMDIFAYAPDSAGAQDYRMLTMELLSKGFFR
jgi:chromosome partitioning protein